MKTRKAAAPSSITSEWLKVHKDDRVKNLGEMADDLLQEKEIPESWRRSIKKLDTNFIKEQMLDHVEITKV